MENRVHIWIGNNFSSEEAYLNYFELDYSIEGNFDDPAYRPCPFCEDIGTQWYDTDFIGILPRHTTSVALTVLLRDAAIDVAEVSLIEEKCFELGIEKANALFWYQDPQLILQAPINSQFNGLSYIGLFAGD